MCQRDGLRTLTYNGGYRAELTTSLNEGNFDIERILCVDRVA